VVEKDTVSMYFVGAAVARVPPSARQRTLAAAGIPAELLEVPDARVPAASFHALWLAVAEELDDEFFGLDRRRMKVGSFALLCQAAVGAGSLERALKRSLRAFSTFLDDIDGELRRDGDDAVVVLANRIVAPPARRFADETLLVLVHGLASWLIGQRIALLRADFAQDQPPHAAEYRVMYSQQLRFDAERTALRFDARLLDAPVVQGEAALKTFLRSAPQSVFLKYKNTDSWTARLRRKLRGHIGTPDDWPTLEQVADEFHVAASTLRRRLEAEGATYQSVKDSLRRDAAIHHLLTQPSWSIAEVASAVGFQDASAFHRAFKKWSGAQPGEYRARQGIAR
jgi:AraC-like DNA-binding protein